jgi:hypothetical protein
MADMENRMPMDWDSIPGWDRFGIHCWCPRRMPSLGYVEENTEHIALVERNLTPDMVKSYEFRRYDNEFGEARIVMIPIQQKGESIFEDGEIDVYVTDPVFFASFCDQMKSCGAISEDDYETLRESIPCSVSDMRDLKI